MLNLFQFVSIFSGTAFGNKTEKDNNWRNHKKMTCAVKMTGL